MNQESISTLKGIGEKTSKLFEKLGVTTVDELLHYYPRAYEAYHEPEAIGMIKEMVVKHGQTTQAVEGVLTKTAGVVRYGHVQVTTVSLKDLTGGLQIVWFNMPYLRSALSAGSRFIFRGSVVMKRGRLTMEQPEIFSVEAYQAVIHSMQPIYSQTKGLGNKVIVKAVVQALEKRQIDLADSIALWQGNSNFGRKPYSELPESGLWQSEPSEVNTRAASA